MENFEYISIKKVDFDVMMYRYDNNEGVLIRKISPSITIDYAKSEKQTTLYAKIHKAQV